MASLTPQKALFPALTICPNFNSAYNVTALEVRTIKEINKLAAIPFHFNRFVPQKRLFQ